MRNQQTSKASVSAKDAATHQELPYPHPSRPLSEPVPTRPLMPAAADLRP